MTLDERLREILRNLASLPNEEAYDENHFISEIHKAFADEGYRLHLAENVVVVRQEGVMTGQEWYSRFLDEINDETALIRSYKKTETLNSLIEYVLNAAERASGLEEKKDA